MYQSIPKRVYTTKESAMPNMSAANTFSCENRSSQRLSASTADSNQKNFPKLSKLARKLETDDLLLIGLLILLISEDSDNQLLIAVIAFLFFS